MKNNLVFLILLFYTNIFSMTTMNSPEEFYNYKKRIIQESNISSETIDKQIGVFLVHFYQKFISPLINTNCQFEPSCSEYMKQAIIKYGFLKGYIMGLERLIRCNRYARKEKYPVIETKRGKRLHDIPEDNLLKK